MAQNELVHSGTNEVAPICRGKLTTEGFYIFRMPRSDKGVVRGPREVKAKRKAATVVKRGPGRPRVYNGTQRRIVAAALKHYGYTKGLAFLAKERGLEVSKTLARSVAKAVGLTFKRGRPAA